MSNTTMSLTSPNVQQRIRHIGMAIQQNNPSLIATLKHFAAYPTSEQSDPSMTYNKFNDFSKFFTEGYSKVQ